MSNGGSGQWAQDPYGNWYPSNSSKNKTPQYSSYAAHYPSQPSQPGYPAQHNYSSQYAGGQQSYNTRPSHGGYSSHNMYPPQDEYSSQSRYSYPQQNSQRQYASDHNRYDSITGYSSAHQPQSLYPPQTYGTSSSAQTSTGAQPGMPEPLDPSTRAQLGSNLIEGKPSTGWYEPLDASYRMRTGNEARQFFKLGRVFSMLHSEAASETLARSGNDNDAITVVRFGQSVFSQIRRFVVVSVKRGFVYACPISTYTHRGVLKQGCDPAEHTVVYAQGSQPVYLQGESEAGMTKEPIEIIPADSTVTIHPYSRLRFGKNYPIELNVKVKDIGMVHPEHLSKLLHYWTEAQ